MNTVLSGCTSKRAGAGAAGSEMGRGLV
jgi:hypothetical protein